jgi:GDSL-like Lipase/Acylhydrolase family
LNNAGAERAVTGVADMSHVVLLGDSIFDNAAYVRGGPDVIRQLRDTLPAGWRATLAAVDGAVTGAVARQAQDLPPDASHFVASVGGNDALRHIGIFEDASRVIADAVTRLGAIGDGFAREYEAMLDAVLARGLPTALCTVYEPRFPDSRMQKLAVTGLCLFNDTIARQAFARGLPLIDLRLVCNEDGDYANPIEPSSRGGEKIARTIARLLAEHDFSRGRTEVFAR